jgi:hypothetical protein
MTTFVGNDSKLFRMEGLGNHVDDRGRSSLRDVFCDLNKLVDLGDPLIYR